MPDVANLDMAENRFTIFTITTQAPPKVQDNDSVISLCSSIENSLKVTSAFVIPCDFKYSDDYEVPIWSPEGVRVFPTPESEIIDSLVAHVDKMSFETDEFKDLFIKHNVHRVTRSGYIRTDDEMMGELNFKLTQSKNLKFKTQKIKEFTKSEKSKHRQKMRDMSPQSRSYYIQENGVNALPPSYDGRRDDLEKAYAKSSQRQKNRKKLRRSIVSEMDDEKYANSEEKNYVPYAPTIQESLRIGRTDTLLTTEEYINYRLGVDYKRVGEDVELLKPIVDESLSRDKRLAIFKEYMKKRSGGIHCFTKEPVCVVRRQDAESQNRVPYEVMVIEYAHHPDSCDYKFPPLAHDVERYISMQTANEWHSQYLALYGIDPELLYTSVTLNQEAFAVSFTLPEIFEARKIWRTTNRKREIVDMLEAKDLGGSEDDYQSVYTELLEYWKEALLGLPGKLNFMKEKKFLDMFHIVTSSMAAIRLIYKNRDDIEAILEILYLFIGNHLEMRHVHTVLKQSIEAIKIFFIRMTAEPRSEANFFEESSSFLKMMIHSPVAEAIRNLVLNILAFKWFSKPFSQTIMSLFTTKKSVGLLDMFSGIMDSVLEIFKFGKEIIAGAPITEALYMSDPVEHALQGIKKCLLYRGLYYTGLPVEGKRDCRSIMIEMSPLISTLEGFVKANPKHPRLVEITASITQGTEFLLVLRDRKSVV